VFSRPRFFCQYNELIRYLHDLALPRCKLCNGATHAPTRHLGFMAPTTKPSNTLAVRTNQANSPAYFVKRDSWWQGMSNLCQGRAFAFLLDLRMLSSSFRCRRMSYLRQVLDAIFLVLNLVDDVFINSSLSTRSIGPKPPHSPFIVLVPSELTLLDLHPSSPTTILHLSPTLHKQRDASQDMSFHITHHNTAH
jgi:hypothetical protein